MNALARSKKARRFNPFNLVDKIKSQRPRGYCLYTRYLTAKGLNLLEYFAWYYLDGRRTSVKSVSKILFLLPPFSFVKQPFSRSSAYIYFSFSPTCSFKSAKLFRIACNMHIMLFINRPTGSTRDKKRTKSLS